MTIGSIGLGVAYNIVTIATTYDYSMASIRGGSLLADAKSNNNKKGLNKDYALSAHNNNNILPGSPITARLNVIYNF